MRRLLKILAVGLAAATQFAAAHAAGRDPDRRKQYDISLCSSYNRGDATDTSWNAKNGTLQGNATVTSGTRYLTLDGTGDYVDHGDDADWTFNVAGQDQPFSFSVWVYNSSWAGSGSIGLASKGTISGANAEYLFRVAAASAGPQLVLTNPAGTSYIFRGAVARIPSAAWTHVCFVYDGSELSTGISVYINGASVAQAGGSSGTYTGMTNGTGGLFIGRTSASPVEDMPGDVDDARIYNRALTSAEVAAIYSSGRLLP